MPPFKRLALVMVFALSGCQCGPPDNGTVTVTATPGLIASAGGSSMILAKVVG